MKLKSLLPFGLLVLATLASAKKKKKKPPKEDDSFKEGPAVIWLPSITPTQDTVFSWCREYNKTGQCGSMAVKHGTCHDIPTISNRLKGNLEDVGASFGHCMLYDKFSCRGSHTIMFMGEHLWTKGLCPLSRIKLWNKEASSVRCCAGGPDEPWCVQNDLFGPTINELETPRCEDKLPPIVGGGR